MAEKARGVIRRLVGRWRFRAWVIRERGKLRVRRLVWTWERARRARDIARVQAQLDRLEAAAAETRAALKRIP